MDYNRYNWPDLDRIVGGHITLFKEKNEACTGAAFSSFSPNNLENKKNKSTGLA